MQAKKWKTSGCAVGEVRVAGTAQRGVGCFPRTVCEKGVAGLREMRKREEA